MMNTIRSKLRLTGMASGLDTESIVKDLMMASKTKLQSAQKQKTLLEWKREGYRGIMSKLTSFQSKYFGSATNSGLSLGIGDSLRKLSATYSSSLVSVTPSANSTAGTIEIEKIESLATSAVVSSVFDGVSANPMFLVDESKLGEASMAGKQVLVTLNGVQKAVIFPPDGTYDTTAGVAAVLQSQLDSLFGGGKITVSGETSGQIQLSSSNSTLQISIPPDPENVSEALSIGNASNRINRSVALSDAGLAGAKINPEDEIEFTVNGKSFKFTGANTMNEIMNAVNSSDAGVKMTYSELSGRFTMTSAETGSSSKITLTGELMGRLFDTTSENAVKMNQGTDAVVYLKTPNGFGPTKYTRSTNTFDVDGTQLTLLGTTPNLWEGKIEIKLGYKADDVVEKVKAFVKDYNELLSTITGKLNEERNKDYLPLVDEERKEISDKEAEMWTEKAKSGILSGDSTLSAIASELRSAMSAMVNELGGEGGVGILAQLGISTGHYTERGLLHLDEAKLRAAVESDPDKVMDILTQKSSVSYSVFATAEQKQQRYAESGVLWRLSDIVSNHLSTYGKKGALIELVGRPGDDKASTSQYGERIQTASRKIADLEKKMVIEEDRYWKRFTAMEKAMSTLSSQSNWIANMLGGSK
ncbi:MAG: flagellar filament capping protein FliD [Christensenellaceae bacterium]|nr:flagellar filament capping protein FliD [Christensenellaceae bacterium]MEA5068484.1 flagellar filament capping protein FliD [Christensenellaceae bacterium]